MAEIAVIFLLNKLSPLLQEEVQLLSGIRAEVEYIRDELERMTAFLRVADEMEESDEGLKVWVKQVRAVAYDTEDVLDEFILRLAHHRGDGFYASLRKITCLIKNLKARHQIASALQGIKSKVSNISEGHQRYNLRFNILERGSTSTAASNRWYDAREDALLLEETELVGIDEPKKKLTGWLLKDDSRVKVVSVVGMGGLGKTTLVKKVYDDAEVKKHFQNHAWITVSQSFKIEGLLKDMIQQLFSDIKQPVPQGVETMNSHRLKAKINEFLKQSRYMLVLDDVWSIDAWDAIKYALPNNNCGGRVMLTTRNAEVARSTSCIEYRGHVYSLKPLSQEESWTLFCRKTFKKHCCPPHLEKLSESILKKCEGLPLAIVAISGVLTTKDMTRIDEWEMIHRSLGAELEDNRKLKSTEKILSLGYNDLPYYLKSCFLYLSIFPEDHLIERMRLIRLWMAEGFVKVKEGKTLEEVAENYLSELLNRSLIQVAETTSDGRVKMCRIHDLLREIIIMKSKDQNFVAIAKEKNIQWPEKVRRLSVHNTLLNLQQNKTTTQLRSLLLFGVVDSLSKSSIPPLFSGGLRLLTVLDLQAAPLEMFPTEIVKLFHLRYLSLRGTRVKMIPSSIGKLQNLETLDLKRAYVAELPVEILKLQRLRHLLVYRYEIESYTPFHSKCGFKAPINIGGLQSLQKLGFVEANRGGSSNLMEELGRLNQLRRLGILKLGKEDGRALCTSIEKLINLRALSVTSIEEDEIIDLKYLSFPDNISQIS